MEPASPTSLTQSLGTALAPWRGDPSFLPSTPVGRPEEFTGATGSLREEVTQDRFKSG